MYIDCAKITGLCYNQEISNTIAVIFTNKNLKSMIGYPPQPILENIQEKFELILSILPFEVKTIHVKKGESVHDLTSDILKYCSPLLTHSGKIICIVTTLFVRLESRKELIEKAGLCIEAAFSVPAGVFSPQTNIPTILLILSKIKIEKTFVAELSNDATNRKTVLENFVNRKEGKSIQLGVLVNIKKFISLQDIILKKEMQEFGEKNGFQPIEFSQLVEDITLLRELDIEEVKTSLNSIYIPYAGNKQVALDISEIKGSLKNYYQIELKETIINPKYLVNYFNSPIGITLREILGGGSLAPIINKNHLLSCTIYLPDPKIQIKLIDIDNSIELISMRLAHLRRNLWDNPNSHTTVQNDLQKINQKESFNAWVDSIPYPIATILWRYLATTEHSKKIDHLFHFFESFSEFLSVIMLSAFLSTESFYRQECHRWVNNGKEGWYYIPSFGNWIYLMKYLGEALNDFLTDPEKREHCEQSFGNPKSTFFKMLINKDIISNLLQVSTLRNHWKGHGGITSEGINIQRIKELEQKLSELRNQISDGFEGVRLISPLLSSYEDGLYMFNAKELIGSKTPLNEIHIESLNALDRKKLYLIHANQKKPMEIIPFLKFNASTNGIYFYSRYDSNKKIATWLTFHFEAEPSHEEQVNDVLLKIFQLLERKKKESPHN
jgi:hypothetical protein